MKKVSSMKREFVVEKILNGVQFAPSYRGPICGEKVLRQAKRKGIDTEDMRYALAELVFTGDVELRWVRRLSRGRHILQCFVPTAKMLKKHGKGGGS